MKKNIHFIGICGVAMSALALAFKRNGWHVTGSDVGFYPPVSTHLKDAGVDYYSGWHPDKMIANGAPDLVVVGNVASSQNPEWLYVQEHNLTYKSYPEVLQEFFIKKNSVVCAGTFGKTTSTALLTWILTEAGFDPSYMFGGISLNSIPAASLTTTDWSVMEGDEYKASRWDNGPKFAYYKPTHLLLTSIVWDHADIYPTDQSYRAAFQKLFDSIPSTGLRVISEKAVPALILSDQKIITYGSGPACNYVYTKIVQSQNGIEFDIVHRGSVFHIVSPCLGDYMADNITGCFALAHHLGIRPDKIMAAISTFKSLKRRLEKRLDTPVVIFDDIAHSPSKATAIVKTLRQTYRGKIFAIFEPNTGNRRPESANWYNHAFAGADEVLIPRLTKIKIDATDPNPPFEGGALADIIGKTHPKALYIDDDNKLIAYLKTKIQPGVVVVFMGSHGFRGMIETLIEEIKR